VSAQVKKSIILRFSGLVSSLFAFLTVLVVNVVASVLLAVGTIKVSHEL